MTIMKKVFALEILTPDKRVFKGDVVQATMPGADAPFVILYNHAPIISVLGKGKLFWNDGNDTCSVDISCGFVEVNNNMGTACVELK